MLRPKYKTPLLKSHFWWRLFYFAFSDWLQTGCCQLARDKWGDLCRRDRGRHMSNPNFRPRTQCRLWPPPHPLHLHHVLLLHEESHPSKSEGTWFWILMLIWRIICWFQPWRIRQEGLWSLSFVNQSCSSYLIDKCIAFHNTIYHPSLLNFHDSCE